MTREDLDHFLSIVDSMSGDGATIDAAKARLRDEGLTETEANQVIQAWVKLYGKELPNG
jgi:hypothetical protein